MTSGTPLSKDEKQYILDHIGDGPARIAFELGREFSHTNGGFRKRDAVKAYIRRVRRGTPISIEIPPELTRAAQEKGISEDQIRFIAVRAVLQRVKATG